MKSAKLLLLAYRSYKKEGLRDVAASLFMEAMSDKTAPHLMEKLYKLANAEVKTKKVKTIKAQDMDNLNEESSTKLGWDESSESWQESSESEEQEGVELEDEEPKNQSELLEKKAIELLKQAHELEKQAEEGEGTTGKEEEESEEKSTKVEISKIQLAQLKAIANKLACKSGKGAKLAHKLLASLKVKNKRRK